MLYRETQRPEDELECGFFPASLGLDNLISVDARRSLELSSRVSPGSLGKIKKHNRPKPVVTMPVPIHVEQSLEFMRMHYPRRGRSGETFQLGI